MQAGLLLLTPCSVLPACGRRQDRSREKRRMTSKMALKIKISSHALKFRLLFFKTK